jgi:hypothetical protein
VRPVAASPSVAPSAQGTTAGALLLAARKARALRPREVPGVFSDSGGVTMTTPAPAARPAPEDRLQFRARDLRPRLELAGGRSYYRCALSPDERLVAVAVRPLRYDDAGNAGPAENLLPTGAPRPAGEGELWVVPLDALDASALVAGGQDEEAGAAGGGAGEAGEGRVVTPRAAGWGTCWGPCWSPDGRRLAFYSDRDGAPRLWLWDRATGAARRACAHPAVIRFGLEGPRWLPDGRRLAVKLRPATSRPRPTRNAPVTLAHTDTRQHRWLDRTLVAPAPSGGATRTGPARRSGRPRGPTLTA